MRFLPGSAQAIGLVSAGTLASAGSGVVGAWCHPDWGGALFWEERSLGLGEHRMCDWQDPPAGRTALTTEIHCRSIYLNGEDVVEVDHKTHRFDALLTGPDTLVVQFDDAPPVEMTRCDY